MTVRFEQPAAQTRKGYRPKAPATAARMPKMEPGYPWLYAHYPHRWRVEGGEVVPDLVQLSLQPGVGDTGAEDGTGGGHPDGAVLAAQRRGAVVFFDTTLEGRLDGEEYVGEEATKGGRVWLDYAATPIAGSNQVKVDPERRMRLLRAIREMVPAPEAHVLEACIARCENDHAAAFRDADRNPIKAREAERLAAELEVWRAALAGEPEPSPKPKTRRGRSKPAAEE